jgi:hypothetical protein
MPNAENATLVRRAQKERAMRPKVSPNGDHAVNFPSRRLPALLPPTLPSWGSVANFAATLANPVV